jgi:glycosyltransferase involved in cell wall biosynthesis
MTNPSVVVVIPTVGTSKLRRAVESVVKQTYQNVECLVVIDGNQYEKSVINQIGISSAWDDKVKYMVLPYNTGANGFYGHRIYAAIGNLVNSEYVIYLDEDNWFEPDHVETQIKTIQEKQVTWSYSLRKIYEDDPAQQHSIGVAAQYICDDNCESLGKWPVYVSLENYLIDTSSYCVSREIAVKIGAAWYNGDNSGKWGSDRNFFANVKHYFPNFACTQKHTLCYSLGGNEKSVTKDFFLKGNQIMLEKYPNGFPWHGFISEDDDGPYLEI